MSNLVYPSRKISAVKEDFDDNIVSQAKVTKPLFQPLVSSMDSHLTGLGAANLNSFLTTSGIQVSESYANLYNAVKNIKLNAVNVFAERDIQIGYVRVTGASTGTITEALTIGTGEGTYVTSPDEDLNYCPTYIEALVISGVGVKNYYKKIGYGKEGPYMAKRLE